MNKRFYIVLAVLGLLTLTFGVLASHFIVQYIQALFANPDSSYISAILQKHVLKNPMEHTSEWYGIYIPAVLSRILWMCYLTAGFILYLAMTPSGQKHWRKFWCMPSTAFNLGVLRIAAVTNLLVYDSGAETARNILNLTFEGMNVPFGYGIFKSVLPPSSLFLETLLTIYPILGWLALLGILVRYTMPLLAFVSFFVLLFPQFVGKMNHYHHIWLVLVFLCFSPCADALSVDSLVRRYRGFKLDAHLPQLRYGRPIVYTWLVLGAAYFFPGFWKFAASGWDWALTDNVQLKIITKIWELGTEPTIPLQNYPLLCKLGGIGTLVLEIGFPFAMIFPPTRALFAIGAISFHEINKYVMQISFASIEWYYVSFINWSKLFKRPSAFKPALFEHIPLRSTVVCSIAAGGMYFAGITAIESWPWANYPTFAPLEERFVNSIEMRINTSSGETQSVLLQNDPSLIEYYGNRTRLRSYLTQVMMEVDTTERTKKLQSLYDLWKKDKSVPASEKVEFWQVQVPLLPLGAPYVPYKQIGVL